MKSLKAIPVQQKLEDDIIQQINEGTLKPGDRIIPEAKLKNIYKMSLRAVRSALENLEKTGRIYRIQGKGSFVSEKDTKKETIKSTRKEIGIIFYDIVSTANLNFSNSLKLIEEKAEKFNWNINLFPIGGNREVPNRSALLKDLILRKSIDGAIILSWIDKDELLSLEKHDVPFVVLGFEYSTVSVPTVLEDIRDSVNLFMGHLLEKGHKKIGLALGTTGIRYSDSVMAKDKILDEYRKIISAKGLKFNKDYCRLGLYTERDGYRMANELLALPEKPTAIVATGGEISNGCLKAINERKLKIPEDITLIPITSDNFGLPFPFVQRQSTEITETAVNMLQNLMANEKNGKTKILVKSKLVFQ